MPLPVNPTIRHHTHGTDRDVLSLKWNNHIAIRKHNRNILLHIEVKSYTTPGRLCSSQKQAR